MPELTLRDGMVIVGSLLILAVAIDAWRRMRQQQRSRVRVRLATDIPGDDPIDDIGQFRELPNGGARVVNRDESTEKSLESLGLGSTDAGTAIRVPGKKTGADSAAAGGRIRSRSRSPEPAPDPDPGAAAASASAASAAASAAGEGGKRSAKTTARAAARELAGAAAIEETAEAVAGEAVETVAGGDDYDEVAPLAGVTARDDEPTNLDWLDQLPPAEPAAEAEELPRQSDSEVIVLHVMARDDGGFEGQDILEILLGCDLRFGDMDFFHRHEQQAGRGKIQFSVANMLNPGVFDIDRMSEMRTRGLVFFLTLPGPEDMILAFDCMLETARTVARNLSGELLDSSRSVLTQQAVEHSRQQIRELDRRLRAREL